MNRFRISTPEGTRDLLFSSCRALRQTENAVREALEERGYSEIITPAVEYFDVFAQANPELDQDQMLKIIDKSGRICVARPDNTTPIARIAATRLDDAALPVRLYYSQKVFRSVSGDHGHKGEFLQVGAELIGADGLAADKDILSAAFAGAEQDRRGQLPHRARPRGDLQGSHRGAGCGCGLFRGDPPPDRKQVVRGARRRASAVRQQAGQQRRSAPCRSCSAASRCSMRSRR